MITTITLRISGDTWYNPQELQAELGKLQPEQYVILDVNSEGPALTPFGIYDILSKYSCNYIFARWPNHAETMPYSRAAGRNLSHFFPMSWRYWIEEIPNDLAKRPFGLFVGRSSISRNCIMYDVYTQWRKRFLMSKMQTHLNDHWGNNLPQESIKIDDLSQWGDSQRCIKIKEWWQSCPITSIDNKHVWDQYTEPEISAAQCISSLLSHYNQFNFELVCETYTLGTTFFPTEKTVRPIMGNKPFIIYGPRHFLKNLQNLGFKTFSGLWNEQYDNYQGPQRWKMMQSIIEMICNWDDTTRQNVLTQCASITRHNRKRLKEIINDNKRV